MLIESGIQQLRAYALMKSEEKPDSEFLEFANNLCIFIEKNKKLYNINDKNILKDLIKQNTNNEDIMQKLYAIASFAVIEEISENGFIDCKKFHFDFQNSLAEAKKQEATLVRQKTNIQTETAIEMESDNVETKQELLEQINGFMEDSLNLTMEAKDIQGDIERIEEIKSAEDFVPPTNNDSVSNILSPENNINQAVSANEMIDFINDPNQIHYPFSMEQTLYNKIFMKDFHNILKDKSTQELQKLVDNIRAKNDILRREISELNNRKKHLLKTLKEETLVSEKLSVIHKENAKEIEKDFIQTDNKVKNNKNMRKK